MHREHLWIDGRWSAPHGDGVLEVFEPALESVLARVPAGTRADADAAVQAARRAFPAWSRTPAARRGELLARLAERLDAHAEELAVTVAREVGTPIKLARAVQVGLPRTVLASFAELAPRAERVEALGRSRVLRRPAGVAACITPWNFPLHQLVAKLGAALAAGCTVVAKPSELAPLAALRLAELSAEAGLPAGVFNLVTGTGAEVGEALAAHPEVDLVSFTGSTRAGRRVAALAARSTKRVALELGGKSPALVLAGADLQAAVRASVSSCLFNSGQTCSALTRLIVPRDDLERAEQLAAEAAGGLPLGDPLDEATRQGPLISAEQRARVRGFIERAQAAGARLVLGGATPPEGLARGWFVRPTVFSDVDPEGELAREEVFGPVLALFPHDGEDHAVALAESGPYGLAAAVWSGERERSEVVARRLRVGQVALEGAGFDPLAPFGGFGASGLGRELGPHGLEEFLELQALSG